MEFTFEKVQRIEDANIYRVSNITDIYETDLFDDYNRNVDNLSLLVQERINQFIVHVDKSEEKNVKEEIESKTFPTQFLIREEGTFSLFLILYQGQKYHI